MSTKVHRVSSLPGKAKNRGANEYVSSCSRCRRGIFKSQEYRWGMGRELGFVHDYDCIGETSCNP